MKQIVVTKDNYRLHVHSKLSRLTSSARSTLAPAAIRISTTSKCPSCEAMKSGVTSSCVKFKHRYVRRM